MQMTTTGNVLQITDSHKPEKKQNWLFHRPQTNRWKDTTWCKSVEEEHE